MKILVPFLLLLLAFGQSLQAQENDTLPPPIDFKEYVAIMTPKMCDSIYRVDTLYYPFEGNVQMIELRLKTVRKKKDCIRIFFNSFGYMPSIFIFRNKAGKFTKIYNNNSNIIINARDFKSRDFVNTEQYPSKYIGIKRNINKYIKPSSKDSLVQYYFELSHDNLGNNKGLINRKGEIIIPIAYKNIYINERENTILLITDKNEQFTNYTYLNYSNLKVINKHDFNRIYAHKNYINKYNILKTSNGKTYLIDNKGNFPLPNNTKLIAYYPEAIVISNQERKLGLLNQDCKYLIPHIYDSIHVFHYNNEKEDYFLQVYSNKQVNIIDKNNKALLEDKYDSIVVSTNLVNKEYFFLVQKENKWGVYSENFKLVIPIIYDKIIVQSNHLQILKDNKWGIYNSDYKLFLDHKFDIINAQLGCFILKENNDFTILYGIHDKTLYAMPIQYKCDSIEYVEVNEKEHTILATYFEGKQIELIELID